MVVTRKMGKFILTALVFFAMALTFPVQGKAQEVGKVSGLNGRLVEISLDKAEGVDVGTKLNLIRMKEIKRGETVLRTDTLKISELEVVKFEEGAVLAKMLRSYRPLEEGDLVVLVGAPAPIAKPVAPAPKPVPP